ncbi:reticulon-3-B isoform X2 [Fundulus heteroclitus]|uniref:reticulon-3-B isoform X2 n=1 Tax=Fundulus heteroclitus TaxID=8078 RepID=UPI00165C0E97|nr:reticulon-3-B isoform X2 [Fundulus heteroclitus]
MEEASSLNHSSSSLKELSQAAVQLIHWREPKKSAVAFSVSLVVLVAMATLSVISVMSYLLLACLCVTITFRVYKSVIQAVQKSNEGHPFRSQLDRDISVSSESARLLAEQCRTQLNRFSVQTRRLLLVEDLVDSLKLAAVMWLMTYVGAMFNGVTILILADVLFFTAPLIYQKKKSQIDRHVELLQSNLEKVLQRLQDKLPGAVRRTKAD